MPALTLEVWIRRWRTIGRQAIISQFDQPDACGFGLFVNEDGSLGFYLGDGGAFVAENLHTTPPGQLRMEVNPQGLKTLPGQHAQLGALEPVASRRCAVRWHRQADLGRRPRGGQLEALRVRCGPAMPRCGSVRPARTGSPTAFLDADIAMPAIYGKALSPAEIAARFADRGLVPADGSRRAGVLAARRGTGRARGGRRVRTGGTRGSSTRRHG